VRVAVVQQAPRGDVPSTIALQESLIRQAADAGARLVVLPEGGLCGFARRHDEALNWAQPLDGPYVAGLATLSTTLRVAIVAHVYEPMRLGARLVVFNTTLVVDHGTLRKTYRKVHLFDAQSFCESAVVEPGDPAQLRDVPVDVDGLSVGLATCFDLRFAEHAVLLARHGATLLAVPAAWVGGPQKRGQWEVLLRARAIETGCFVAGAGQPGPQYSGGSAVYGPSGDAVSQVLGHDVEGIAVGEVDARVTAQVRAQTPTLRHRPAWDAR
jgi:deaminated glutathione amidase